MKETPGPLKFENICGCCLWYSNRHRNSYLLCNHLLLCNTGIIIVCGLLSCIKASVCSFLSIEIVFMFDNKFY